MNGLKFGISLVAVAVLAIAGAFGNSTTCNGVTVPGGSGCTASITYADEAAVEGVCADQPRTKITITMVCGTTTCTRVFIVCQGSQEDLEFNCAGNRYKGRINSPHTWGEMPSQLNGATCADGTIQV